MCIACEIAFMDMLEHVSDEERARALCLRRRGRRDAAAEFWFDAQSG
jgi:hypothetical protein